MNQTSKQRVKVVVNGKPYSVEVGDLTISPISVSVNGQPYQVTIEPEGIEAVTPAGSVVPERPASEKSPPASAPAGLQVNEVTAPMPGNILDIAVRPGDEVRFGQPLCSLEAMKMKNAIRSPRDGVIATVEVTEGQTVAHGDVLFTFE